MKRNKEWEMFSKLVAHHIKDYTIPQYGDYPDDGLMDYTPKDCIKEIKKYASRHFSGQRGEDELRRDLLKIAHYAAACWRKELEELKK